MLKDVLKELNISDEQIDKLNKLREICLKYNEHTNLTNITNEKEFNIKHIFDSLSINKYLTNNTAKLLDIGSGGGFPGLALAIINPSMFITMVDSNNKKIKFIDQAIEELGLTNAEAVHSRIEELEVTEKFDYVVSRAVSSLNILIEISAFATKINGELIFYKGINLKNELPKTWVIVEKELGIYFEKIEDYNLDNETTRKLIFFKKLNKTKKEYPRLYSLIKSKPIYN